MLFTPKKYITCSKQQSKRKIVLRLKQEDSDDSNILSKTKSNNNKR